MRVLLMSLCFIASSYASDVKAGFLRRLSSPVTKQIDCPAGLVDHTGGNPFWWECGRARGCPGAFPWADEHCYCACVAPTECLAKTAKDPCVTSWERHVPDSTTEPLPIPLSTSLAAPIAPALQTPQQPKAIEAAQAASRTSPKAQAEAGPSAPPDGSSALVVILCIVLACALACSVLFCCICACSTTKLPAASGSRRAVIQPTYQEGNGAGQAALPTLLRAPTHAKHVQPRRAWDHSGTSKAAQFSSVLPSSSSQQHDVALQQGGAPRRIVPYARELDLMEQTHVSSPGVIMPSNLVQGGIGSNSATKQSLQEIGLPQNRLISFSSASNGDLGGESLAQVPSDVTVCKASVRSAFGLPAI